MWSVSSCFSVGDGSHTRRTTSASGIGVTRGTRPLSASGTGVALGARPLSVPGTGVARGTPLLLRGREPHAANDPFLRRGRESHAAQDSFLRWARESHTPHDPLPMVKRCARVRTRTVLWIDERDSLPVLVLSSIDLKHNDLRKISDTEILTDSPFLLEKFDLEILSSKSTKKNFLYFLSCYRVLRLSRSKEWHQTEIWLKNWRDTELKEWKFLAIL